MQDFNYLFSNCMEITVELSCCKYPLEDTLQGHWEDNREALLAYVEAVQAGLRGIVRDAEGEPVANAIIEVAGIEKNVTTSFRGEFWRLLSAGRYWQVMMMMMMLMLMLMLMLMMMPMLVWGRGVLFLQTGSESKISAVGAAATNLLRPDFQGMPRSSERVHPRKEMSFLQLHTLPMITFC